MTRVDRDRVNDCLGRFRRQVAGGVPVHDPVVPAGRSEFEIVNRLRADRDGCRAAALTLTDEWRRDDLLALAEERRSVGDYAGAADYRRRADDLRR